MPSKRGAFLAFGVALHLQQLATAFNVAGVAPLGAWGSRKALGRPGAGICSPMQVRRLRGGQQHHDQQQQQQQQQQQHGGGGALGLQGSIRVASYNVLSSSLCEPSYYTNSDPDALDPPQRLLRVIRKIEDECDKGAVVCLQEISRDWSGELHRLFAARGYHLLNVGYGVKFNGYMGVALAFKMSDYELLDAGIERVSAMKEWPRPPPPGRLKAFKMYWAEVIRKLRKKKRPDDEWGDAERRHNCLIWTRLRERSSGKEFGVATYHMPCQFRIPSVMVIHTALVAQRLADLFKSTPLIWCGDFNFKPGDAPYRLLTEGGLDESDQDFPGPRPNDDWVPRCPLKMESAYKQLQGQEPAYTNWAQTRGSPPFMGTLDYIFVSEGCKATDVLSLPTEMPPETPEGEAKPRGVLGGPFPTMDEPSDHLMVAATINLP